MTPKSPKSLREIVFEIGCEELPATNLADIFETAALEKTENPLLEKWKKAFSDNRISFDSAEVWATPRRLVFFAAGAAASQEKKDQLTRLLAKQEAYDAQNNPTERFLTILRHRNATTADTLTQEQGGREFVFLRKAEAVRKTSSVLPELLESFVKSLAFPKNMKWDDSGVYFPRPIRSTLCFYGDECVKFKIGRARSSDRVHFFSRGKRASAPVASASAYFKALEKNGVLLDPARRKDAIRSMLERLARAHQGRLHDDPFLLAEVNFLVETPDSLAAPFDEEFLKLPFEVLTVSMARKQRIFGLVDRNNHVLPRFLAILDGVSGAADKKAIARNYENILHAKLQDSLFFFKEDLKIPLEKKREELKNLVFLKGAGSMLEKSERLVRLSKSVSQLIGLTDPEQRDLERASRLSKADLLTQMVGEFPELQGVIGRYYAAAGGEKENVAAAIGEQYLPRTASDRLPATKTGALLSMIDKADLVTSCFGLGLEPTSSMDPYGLRRSATAVLKIIIDQQLDFSFKKFLAEVEEAAKSFVQKEGLQKKIQDFFRDRFLAWMSDRGYRQDLVEAAASARFESPFETFRRVHALAQFAEKGPFLNACKVVERTHNILKANKETLPSRPDKSLFAEPLEHAVMEHLEKHESGIVQAKRERDFSRATNLYAEAFFDILNEFFDKVFINAEDIAVRKNRLSLLKAIKELYTGDIADLSKIQVQSAAASAPGHPKREK